MSQTPGPSGSGQRQTPGPSRAWAATIRLVEATESDDGSREADEAGADESAPWMDRGMINASTPPPPYTQTDNLSTQTSVERFVRDDGKVAVVVSYSPGWEDVIFNGSHSLPGFTNPTPNGWSTRVGLILDPRDPASSARTRKMEEIAMFDKDIVTAVLDRDVPRANAIALAKMGLSKEFAPNHTQLKVQWVTRGDEFVIADSPAFERVRLKRAIRFWRA